jgi:molybdopterin synthase catalytic subunit
MIKIQTDDFDVSNIYAHLKEASPNKTGAICLFTGIVREFGDQHGVSGLELEHYPGMTEKQLQKIVDDAKARWPIHESYIIHRVGKLELNDQIVAVGVNSAHRDAAFEACQYIMDYLKKNATIWKKELGETEGWVEAKHSDNEKAERWK